MENRTLVIADELFGSRGEAAELFSQLLLCLEPERPRQFVFNAPLHGGISELHSKVELDIIGKQAGRLILGLGVRELRRGTAPEILFEEFRNLVFEISARMNCEIYVLTIPEAASPNTPSSVQYWNELLSTIKKPNVFLLDFASAEKDFQQKQASRGKFVRNLWEESGNPTSICLTFLALFLKEVFLKRNTQKF